MSFAIVTDTSANLPTAYLRENNIPVTAFSYFIEGREFMCTDTEAFDAKAYYGAIREGTRSSTSLVPPQRYIDCFRPILERGEDILFVGMSSGISGSFGVGQATAAQLLEEFPERRIRMIDSLGASLGEGLLVMRAVERRAQGKSLDQVADELSDMLVGMCQVFTVDDLMHLRRTGRLSNAAAVIATVLNIKPLLKGNQNGQIVSFEKVRGRKRSIEAIAANYDKLVVNPSEQIIGIAHADCGEDMEYLCTLLRKNNPPKDILVVDYEPVTGSHVGPGALALFFEGSREFRAQKHL